MKRPAIWERSFSEGLLSDEEVVVVEFVGQHENEDNVSTVESFSVLTVEADRLRQESVYRLPGVEFEGVVE